MAVPVQTPANVSTANGISTVFPYDFLILDSADLLVTGTLDGITTTYVLNVDYTVGGAADPAGGDVTFTVAPANGTEVLRKRAMTAKRDEDYQSNGDFIASEVNADYDRAIMLIQQLLETQSRTLELPAHLVGVDAALPEPEPLALFGWNAAANGVTNYPPEAFVAATTAGVAHQYNVSAGDTTLDVSAIVTPFGIGHLYYNGIFQDPSAYSVASGLLTFTEALPADGTVTIVAVFRSADQITDDDQLYHTPAATGAVTRSIRAKLGERVSVFDFIPVAEQAAITAGTTAYDATADIQAAIDHVRLAGGTLHFPAGVFLVTALEFYGGVSLRGAGRGVTFLRAKSGRTLTDPLLINGDVDTATSARTCADVVIEDITFDGNDLAYPHWLQNPTTLATIADPEADYFANGGKIDDPAYAADQDGVCLAQNPASGASLVINGALSAAGSVNLAPAVRRVTVYSAFDASSRTFTVTGTDYSGAALVESIAGPTAAATVTTDGVFKTITAVSVDATAPTGNVEVGATAFDIFGVVAEGRRNPAFTSGYLLSFIKTIDCTVQRCAFINHNGPVISEGGSLNLRIRQCHFEDVGRDDGPFPAVWAQSYGSPASPPVYYQDTENVVIEDCTAKNLRRLFAIFAPTKGGTIRNCRVDGYGESCIFGNTDYLNLNGGRTRIEGNTLLNGVVTDIVSHAIEYTGAERVDIVGNHIEGNEATAIAAQGMQDCTIEGNTIKEVGGGFTYPYGPFSERYSYGVGTAYVAGTTVAVADTSYITIGSIGAKGNNNLRITGNKFLEARASYPPLFKQTKSGTNFIAENVYIERNTLEVPAAMTFLDKTITNVWNTEMSLFIRGNIGHVSEAPVSLSYSFTSAAGAVPVSFTPGFRPSRIEIIAARTGLANENRTWDGNAVWRRAATGSVPNSAQGRAANNAGAARVVLVLDNTFIRIVDSAGATTTDIDLTSWQEDGFTVTVNSIADTTVAARIVCHP